MLKRWIFCFVTVIYMLLFGCSPHVGDVIESKDKTIQIAREQAGIVEVESLEMSTAGPIYRVVFGKDKTGLQKAVWVGKEVHFTVDLAAGIRREEAKQLAIDKGFANVGEMQLVYIPEFRDHEALNHSTGQVFWMIRSGDGFDNRELFIDFYTGNIASD